MKIAIRGMGTALPAASIDQADAAFAADRLRRFDEGTAGDKRSQMLSILYRRSGVKKRYCILLGSTFGDPIGRQSFYEVTQDPEFRGPSTKERMTKYAMHAPELAEQACRASLEDAACKPGEITHLVTVSCSGFSAPGFDLDLYPRLGLNPSASRTHVGFMGCHGFLNGLRVARAYAASDPKAKVLVCALELCTLHHQYSDDPQQIVANSLFADGAASVVVESVVENDPSTTSSNGENCYGDFRASGSYRIADSEEMMTWKIGDHGFQMSLSAQVPETIQRELKPWVVNWLAGYGLKFDEIKHWAIHPGGPRILSATAESLGLPAGATDISTNVLAECGNMSSPTILFILDRMKKAGLRPPIVALAFGPGLVVEAALFA